MTTINVWNGSEWVSVGGIGPTGPEGPTGPTGPAGADGGGATTMDSLTDVSATAPADGQMLLWDETAGLWVLSDPPSGASELADIPTAETNANAVLQPDGAGGAGWVLDRLPPLAKYLQVVTTGGGAVYVPDAAIPRAGAAIWSDGGDTGCGMMLWYRHGTYNRVTGMRAAATTWAYREATFSAAAPFSFYIESNAVGARLVCYNNAGYGRTLTLWVFA